MASRRDQLNAYTFARKRMVAAFLQPSASGSEEGAPRPLRAVVPSLVVAGLVLAGFVGWGLIKPGAPPGWSAPETNVLVGSESTTRYVVLGTKKHPVLYPVLNLASARLLLNPSKFAVLKVDESVLDNGKIPHGPTIGIPYAPDRLPDPGDAGTRKLWSVCEQPGRGSDPQKAAFVFAESDAHRVDGRGRLTGSQALFVKGPDGALYLVSPSGTAYPLDTTGLTDPGLLVRALLRNATPQQVTQDWLNTFNQGQPIHFPSVTGFGASAGLPKLGNANRVGMVITSPTGYGSQTYVVLQGKVAEVSPLVAALLLRLPGAQTLYGNRVPEAQEVPGDAYTVSPSPYLGDTGWPQNLPRQTNTSTDSTMCSVYRGKMTGSKPELSVWTGVKYPAAVVNNGATAYVTPGSGLLYRQTTGTADGGPVYLVTDTGLRYNVPGGQADQGTADARTLLGYGQVQPLRVPAVWSAFLPTGPTLDPKAAAQQQGS